MNEMRPIRRSSTKIRSFLWIFLLVLLAAAGAWAWFDSQAQQISSLDKTGGYEAPVVHTAVADKRDFPIYLNGLGNVQAWNTVAIRSRVDGQVEKLNFREGQLVHEGDVLVELDARPFEAEVDQATAKVAQDKASRTSARSDLARTTSLVKNGYATWQLFDQQTANVSQFDAAIDADKAALENAKVQLSYTTIKAPITGRIGLRTIDVGNIVHATDVNPVVTITQTQPISVIFTAPEAQLPAIVEGFKAGTLPVIALTPDGKTQLAEGKLWTINNEVDIASGTVRLKGWFANSEEKLWPGLSVMTRLFVKTIPNATVIPDAAVQHGPSGLFSYVVGPDNKIEKRDIEVGSVGDGYAQIDAGIEPGEQVVTSGQYGILPGTKVTVQHGAGKPKDLAVE